MRHEPILQNQIDEYGMDELPNGGHLSEDLNSIIDGIDNPNNLAHSGFTVVNKSIQFSPAPASRVNR